MAEGARLESVYAGNRIEGSNPSPSANAIVLADRYRNSYPFMDLPDQTASAVAGHSAHLVN